MCCLVGFVWKWALAVAVLFALIYSLLNIFLIWGDASIKLEGHRAAGWSDISENTATLATLTYMATCVLLTVACIFNTVALYIPFIVASLIFVGVLIYHEAFFLNDVPAETMFYVTIAIVVIILISLVIAVLSCLKTAIVGPHYFSRRIRLRNERSPAGAAQPAPLPHGGSLAPATTPPLSMYYGDIAEDDYNYGRRRRGDMVEPVPIEHLERGERGLLSMQKAQDIFIKPNNGFARRHRVVSSWGFPSWNFPPVPNVPPVSSEPYEDSSDSETTVEARREGSPPGPSMHA